MNRQGRMEEKNKTLDTERCKQIDNLYINKIIMVIVIDIIKSIAFNISKWRNLRAGLN